MVIKDSYTPITNAAELRIGNWISVIGLCPKQADAFHIKFISEGDDQYAPIPLTEEWLIKFGFEKENNPELYVKSDLIIFKDIGSVIGLPIGSFYASLNQRSVTHIKHVHQLQNLYFALTGEELTIKE